MRIRAVGLLQFLILIAGLAAFPLFAAEPVVVLGITTVDAAKRDIEYQRYSRIIPVYKERDIAPALCEHAPFDRADWSEERIVEMLKKFHVVQLVGTHEGVPRVTAEHMARAKVVSAALARYVQDGGGLYLQPLPARYPNDQDEIYWNLIYKTFGAELLHEGTYDATRSFTGTTLREHTFWFTRNLQKHPVTEGVRGLCLPLHDYGAFPGVAAMKYSTEWQVVVGGEAEAKSYKSGEDNAVNIDVPGTYAANPPVVAVRTFGKGRVVCFPLAPMFSGMNYLNPLWANIVESAGDIAGKRPSDGMKLMLNAVRWAAEPALATSGLGTYKVSPYQPVQFPKSVNWDQRQFDKAPGEHEQYPAGQVSVAATVPSPTVRGIMGIHTAYTDGKGTVADYVAAAKAAGLGFIVFADPLEKLTPEALEKLKADCKAASAADDFYACPGIEFTDGPGNRWYWWGEKLLWPEESFGHQVNTNWKYTQWDGKRVNYYGKYAAQCGFPGSATLDYKQLRANGTHPENMWWFYHYVPFVYEVDKLVADQFGEYLHGLNDLRWAALATYTKVTAPAEVAAAAGACVSTYPGIAAAKKALNTRCNTYGAGWWSYSCISQGPEVVCWQAINRQMEQQWAITRGAQRVRCRFVVRSGAGIAEVKVHDGERGVYRRFAGNGAKEFSREFEVVHDKQHYLTLEVTDTAGKKAIAPYILIFSYKQGLSRCGDNLNILGATGMIWHPDRNEMLPLARNLQNGEDFALRGWDTGIPLCPMPKAWPQVAVNSKEYGHYPDVSQNRMVGWIMDYPLGSYNVQVARMTTGQLSERFNDEARPAPALCSLPKDMEALDVFQRTHTIYSLADRTDWYTVWNYRRSREGRQNYQGGFIWHEGEIRFKKDLTLVGGVPIPLAQMRCPADLEKNMGNVLVVTDTDGGTNTLLWREQNKRVPVSGRIRPGGYLSQMPTLPGYHAFIAPHDMDFAYQGSLPDGITVGLGRDGQQVKAGTVLKYRFAFGAYADPVAGNPLIEHTVKAMNLGGGREGYPVEMKTGECTDATFWFCVQAKDSEAAFKLGPQKLIIDLPVKVAGITDNGCAAVYSTKRPWFRFISVMDGTALFQEPIDAANDMWVGNVFVADDPAIRATFVEDGQADGKPAFVEVHNPTAKEITTQLRSPAHTPRYGGAAAVVKVPAGDSIRLRVKGKELTKF